MSLKTANLLSTDRVPASILNVFHIKIYYSPNSSRKWSDLECEAQRGKSCAQGHIANRRQSQYSNPGSLTPDNKHVQTCSC